MRVFSTYVPLLNLYERSSIVIKFVNQQLAVGM